MASKLYKDTFCYLYLFCKIRGGWEAILAQPCIFFLSTFSKAEKPLYSKKAILEGNCMQMWQLSFEAPHLTFMHTSHKSPHIQGRGASHIVILLRTLALQASYGSWLVSCTCCHSISVSRLEVAATLPPPQLITRPLLCLPHTSAPHVTAVSCTNFYKSWLPRLLIFPNLFSPLQQE